MLLKFCQGHATTTGNISFFQEPSARTRPGPCLRRGQRLVAFGRAALGLVEAGAPRTVLCDERLGGSAWILGGTPVCDGFKREPTRKASHFSFVLFFWAGGGGVPPFVL